MPKPWKMSVWRLRHPTNSPGELSMNKDRKTFSFYLSRTPGYWHPQEVSLQDIDMGIAMCHFELTAQRTGA